MDATGSSPVPLAPITSPFDLACFAEARVATRFKDWRTNGGFYNKNDGKRFCEILQALAKKTEALTGLRPPGYILRKPKGQVRVTPAELLGALEAAYPNQGFELKLVDVLYSFLPFPSSLKFTQNISPALKDAHAVRLLPGARVAGVFKPSYADLNSETGEWHSKVWRMDKDPRGLYWNAYKAFQLEKHIVTHICSIGKDVQLGSEIITDLQPGDEVEIVEVVELTSRTRGRLERGGWISLWDPADGLTWVKPKRDYPEHPPTVLFDEGRKLKWWSCSEDMPAIPYFANTNNEIFYWDAMKWCSSSRKMSEYNTWNAATRDMLEHAENNVELLEYDDRSHSKIIIGDSVERGGSARCRLLVVRLPEKCCVSFGLIPEGIDLREDEALNGGMWSYGRPDSYWSYGYCALPKCDCGHEECSRTKNAIWEPGGALEMDKDREYDSFRWEFVHYDKPAWDHIKEGDVIEMEYHDQKLRFWLNGVESPTILTVPTEVPCCNPNCSCTIPKTRFNLAIGLDIPNACVALLEGEEGPWGATRAEADKKLLCIDG